VLERLSGFLPIILLVVVPSLLGLRRLIRRRRSAAAARSAEEQAAQAEQPETEQEPPELTRAMQERMEVFPPRNWPGRSTDPGSTGRTVVVPAATVEGSAREQYVYPPQLRFDRLPEAPSQRRRGPARSTSADFRRAERFAGGSGAGWHENGADGEAPPRAGWRRIDRLPPLQRAIVFAEILGPPRGLGTPGYDESLESRG
jgi:hypothetical protein